MDYQLRRIKATDFESTWNLIELLKKEGAEISFTDLTTREELEQFVDNPAQLTYVAINTASPENILCLVRGKRELTPEKAHAVFLTAATHPSVRGTGLVAKLTNYALNQMKEESVSIARIYVYSNNKASLKAVSKLGFTHAGTVLMHHKDLVTGEYVDDLIFHKLLV